MPIFSRKFGKNVGLSKILDGEVNRRKPVKRPYTPRHNGKVERSHREDQKRFYSSHSFFDLDDFAKQLAVHVTDVPTTFP